MVVMRSVLILYLAFCSLTASYRRIIAKVEFRRISTCSMVNQRAPSFVQDELRPYAMKLHTKDQAREGQQQAQVPFTKWDPTRAQYLQFLVDSLAVYNTLEDSVVGHPELGILERTGLERSEALKKDIAWMCEYDRTLSVPTCGEAGRTYSSVLKQKLATNIPAFVCHYYNQYFAHTAGGLRIGQGMADKLLGGKKLHFYTYEGGADNLECTKIGTTSDIKTGGGGVSSGDDDNLHVAKVNSCAQSGDNIESSASTSLSTAAHDNNAHSTHSKHDPHDPHVIAVASGLYNEADHGHTEVAYVALLKEELRRRIDRIAQHWAPGQREACCKETINCFKYGGGLLAYLNTRSTSSIGSSSGSSTGDGSVGGAGSGESNHIDSSKGGERGAHGPDNAEVIVGSTSGVCRQ